MFAHVALNVITSITQNMSTVTIEIASDVVEDKFDSWLEVSDMPPTTNYYDCHIGHIVGEDISKQRHWSAYDSVKNEGQHLSYSNS